MPISPKKMVYLYVIFMFKRIHILEKHPKFGSFDGRNIVNYEGFG